MIRIKLKGKVKPYLRKGTKRKEKERRKKSKKQLQVEKKKKTKYTNKTRKGLNHI